MYGAIADPTRRAILDGLGRGARKAGEIAEDFKVSRPAISRHLRVLREADLVRVERVGREQRYSLNPGPLAEIDGWLDRFRLMWSSRLVDLKELAEQQASDERKGEQR